MDCSNCHGNPFNGNFLDAWKMEAPPPKPPKT
jgi:hypothetical protein